MTGASGHAPCRVAVLHGAGYTGAELIGLLLAHPTCTLSAVTSRSFAGRPLWDAHPALRGSTDLAFTAPDDFDPSAVDAVFLAAEHGRAAGVVATLLADGFDGFVVDLSADFRLRDPAVYEARYGRPHPAPELLSEFEYGLADVRAPYPEGTRLLANPGCFATGLALSLWPLGRGGTFHAAVTALTGASGSGARPSDTTHFPTREGNVRSYRELRHQHLAEVLQLLGPGARVDFVPVSGPWTRGIWGTAHLVAGIDPGGVAQAFEEAYADRPLVRLWPDRLPEMRWSIGSPYCDLGWIARDGVVVVGFALDNLVKGASGQAIQNLNLLRGRPETEGLLPTPALQLQS
jgi:N-acetyl-gamma-glutamyl-phosphate reductase